jgi:Predicted redox protein, regulator of disulfide bond formation
MSKTISAYIGTDKYTTEVRASGKVMLSDEPVDLGGQDKGFTPEELLGASLGACTCITLRMYADRKEWPLERVETIVTIERLKEQKVTNITESITLHGPLSDEQKERLMVIAKKCPIYETLTQPINITKQLSATV